jgi:hypothetical protein
MLTFNNSSIPKKIIYKLEDPEIEQLFDFKLNLCDFHGVPAGCCG